ncbi:MAG TPA: cell wall hydrolase [Opitutaceae bacterium]|nr:cell wall hydrolase [Opitutaceae bacterium]
MEIERRLLAALTALILPSLALGAERFSPLVPPPAPALDEPVVTFTIPRYELTPLERETVAMCLVFEAASQGPRGMRGVMAVVRNRARGLPELFAPTVLREKQFSGLNRVTSGRESLAHAIARAQSDRMWDAALALVDEATVDSWADPTGGATHYTRSAERTPWTRTLAKTVTIGAHSFYR